MKKLISLLSILFLLTLFVPSKQAEAARGSGGSRGEEGAGGFHGSGGREGFRGDRRHERFHGSREGFRGFRGHGGFLPGLSIGGVLGWGLGPYDYPPEYYYPPPVEESPAPPSTSQESDNRMFIYPRQGQSEEKQSMDFDECHDWAVDQTGFDPKMPPEGAPDAERTQESKDYLRAISACLDARGYTLKY